MDNKYLWNDLPKEERSRLMPYMIEAHILHLEQCKEKAIQHHKNHMRDINDHIKNLKKELLKKK